MTAYSNHPLHTFDAAKLLSHSEKVSLLFFLKNKLNTFLYIYYLRVVAHWVKAGDVNCL